MAEEANAGTTAGPDCSTKEQKAKAKEAMDNNHKSGFGDLLKGGELLRSAEAAKNLNILSKDTCEDVPAGETGQLKSPPPKPKAQEETGFFSGLKKKWKESGAEIR